MFLSEKISVLERKVIYSLNMGIWNSIFAVPSEIVDKYINESGEAEIKVLLYLLRMGNKKLEVCELSKALNFSEEKISRALDLWVRRDIIKCADEFEHKVSCDEVLPNTDVKATPELSRKNLQRYQKPDNLYISNRIKTSKDINFLMQEAQVILGRPLSNGDLGSLIVLHDNEGLPVDVIIMLLQYAVGIGKLGMRYIEKMGISWAQQGIDNLEKAEKKITDLNTISLNWKKFESIIGIDHRAPTAREEEAVMRWINDWNYTDELIKEAYDRCVNANGKYILKYMDSIIKRWHTQGIFTIEQALMENNKNRFKNRTNKGENKPSYNIADYENYSIFDDIK